MQEKKPKQNKNQKSHMLREEECLAQTAFL